MLVGTCCVVLLTSKVFPSDFPGTQLFHPMYRKPGPRNPTWGKHEKHGHELQRKTLIIMLYIFIHLSHEVNRPIFTNVKQKQPTATFPEMSFFHFCPVAKSYSETETSS